MCDSIQWSQNMYISGQRPDRDVEEWTEFICQSFLIMCDCLPFAILFGIAKQFAILFGICHFVLVISRNRTMPRDISSFLEQSGRTVDAMMGRVQCSRSAKQPLMAWEKSHLWGGLGRAETTSSDVHHHHQRQHFLVACSISSITLALICSSSFNRNNPMRW